MLSHFPLIHCSPNDSTVKRTWLEPCFRSVASQTDFSLLEWTPHRIGPWVSGRGFRLLGHLKSNFLKFIFHLSLYLFSTFFQCGPVALLPSSTVHLVYLLMRLELQQRRPGRWRRGWYKIGIGTATGNGNGNGNGWISQSSNLPRRRLRSVCVPHGRIHAIPSSRVSVCVCLPFAQPIFHFRKRAPDLLLQCRKMCQGSLRALFFNPIPMFMHPSNKCVCFFFFFLLSMRQSFMARAANGMVIQAPSQMCCVRWFCDINGASRIWWQSPRLSSRTVAAAGPAGQALVCSFTQSQRFDRRRRSHFGYSSAWSLLHCRPICQQLSCEECADEWVKSRRSVAEDTRVKSAACGHTIRPISIFTG